MVLAVQVIIFRIISNLSGSYSMNYALVSINKLYSWHLVRLNVDGNYLGWTNITVYETCMKYEPVPRLLRGLLY